MIFQHDKNTHIYDLPFYNDDKSLIKKGFILAAGCLDWDF